MHAQILKYSWVATLLFLAAAAFLAAQLTSTLLARRLWVAEVETATSEAARGTAVQRDRLADFRVIQDRNIFNANPKPEAPAVPTRPEPVASPTPAPAPAPVPRRPLNITLLGTVVVDGGKSFALIQSGAELKLVREGEEIEAGATLAEVRHDRIQVDRGGGHMEEVLLFQPEATASAARPPSRVPPLTRRQPAPPPPDDSDTVRQVEQDKWLVDAREIDEASENLSKLMTQIRVVPNFTDGQPDGFKVFAIRPGSLFAKIGLQNGDVLKRVNGIEIEGPEQAFQAYQQMRDETTIQVDLVRRNENKSFTYEIR